MIELYKCFQKGALFFPAIINDPSKKSKVSTIIGC